ncbi:MAG: trimethylamine methyltransferase family protein [SAR324 cluster bacterium]|nr:trimethylamine methyltransferase family protein [SAR324 cluster bacterium]
MKNPGEGPEIRKQNRRGGGRKNNTRGKGGVIHQLPWSLPVNSDKPTEPLSEEGIEAIHNGAMRILEELGLEFLSTEAVEILQKAGCPVNGSNVRIGRELVMEQLKLVPSSVTITPRNPERKIEIGASQIVFGNVSSPPNCSDLDRGRRTGTRESFRDLIKLTQYFNCIHFAGGYPVEPMDLHPSIRHLDCLYDKLILTDKVVHAYCLGKERVEDVIEMVRIAGGLSHEAFDSMPRMYTNINSTSPLIHDFNMLDGAMRLARRGQMTVVTPFTLAGAMAPLTMAGAVAQSIAEGLGAIVLLQLVNPGCPVALGTFTSNVDMKSGSPAFGTPEYMRATQMSGQMARFYGLPLRASNACAANTPDSQSAWESLFSLWAAVSAGVNMVYHAAGWLEGGLCASYEKFVMDCETLQQVISYMKPVSVTEDDIAFDAVKEVGPGGHFFACAHTQDRFENAFYSPFLSDWSNFENWQENGAVKTPERANKIWKRILAEFQPPPINEAIREELEAFVAKRKEEGGAPTDY